MSLKYLFTESLDNQQYLQGVWELLCQCDREFVPPLSSRESSFQSALTEGNLKEDVKPKLYFEEMKKQHFILAIDQETNQVAGFMTFKHNYQAPELKQFSPSNYITTICVDRNHRNKGLTKQFYNMLFTNQIPEAFHMPFISTRTWSGNSAHIHVLSGLDFKISKQLLNHRGKNIDTIYFAKRVQENG